MQTFTLLDLLYLKYLLKCSSTSANIKWKVLHHVLGFHSQPCKRHTWSKDQWSSCKFQHLFQISIWDQLQSPLPTGTLGILSAPCTAQILGNDKITDLCWTGWNRQSSQVFAQQLFCTRVENGQHWKCSPYLQLSGSLLRKEKERKQLFFVIWHTIASSFERQGKTKCSLLQKKMVWDNFSNTVCSTKELNWVTNNYLWHTITFVVKDIKSTKNQYL